MPATQAEQEGNTQPDTSARPGRDKFRYATKTALSLVLAYLIPMGLGWPQPQTAAMTVMLIAATGSVSDSLQKGVMRVLGSVAGAVIGLSLIALFPQERLTYLVAVSLAVAICAYLYNAYQGDSTVFMLTSVVTLMVFNGGDAEGAFLYGMDRAFITAFGVVVYTAVASTLWPVHAVDNTRELATTVAGHYSRAFSQLVDESSAPSSSNPAEDQLAQLLVAQEAFQAHFAAIKSNAEGVTSYLDEWNAVLSSYEEMGAILVPALQQDWRQEPDFEQFLPGYHELVARVNTMFQQVEASWQGQRPQEQLKPVAVDYSENSLAGEAHLTMAAVASRADLLERLQQQLWKLQLALDSLLFDQGDFVRGSTPRGKPTFVWLDLENAKTAARSLVTFWIAAAIWIQFNPPGGFMFVALCTILVPMVSYTPVTPKLLFILLSLGFVFALPAYVFLLPQLSHWLELAIFMFAYAFIGFYVFQGPVSIFFLLGLFTLGIQNTMSYNFDAILLLVLMFYLLCTILVITVHFPFTSKPERLYAALCRRFFHACARDLEQSQCKPGIRKWWCRLQAGNRAVLLAKMQLWGGRIDAGYFGADTPSHVATLTQACQLLQGQLQVQSLRREEFDQNRLIADSRDGNPTRLLSQLCDTLATDTASNHRRAWGFNNGSGSHKNNTRFEDMEAKVTGIKQQLDALRDSHSNQHYERHELAQLYVYLYLQASILECLHNCHDAQLTVAWPQLAGHRF